MVKRRYKYIQMQQVAHESFEDKPVYRIYNNRNKAQLGIISWYKPWKCYVFTSREECVFNNECLADVLDFINNVIPTLQ